MLLDKYRAFAVDLDGVVWRGGRFLPGSVDALTRMTDSGKPVLLLTNNATYSPDSVSERLASEGLAFDPGMVMSTSTVARRWIQDQGLAGAPAMLIAPKEVSDQLQDLVEQVEPNRAGAARAQCVLVARDLRFDFARLDAASAAVRRGAQLVSVNRDPVLPVEDDLEPGTGSILAAIEAASATSATVLGKPEAPMMGLAVEILGTEGVVMIGDRIGSDIVGGRSVGWDTALVLSGVTQDLDGAEVKPDHVIGHLLDAVT